MCKILGFLVISLVTFLPIKAVSADQPIKCSDIFPERRRGKIECFEYLKVFWGVGTRGEFTGSEDAYGPTQHEADRTILMSHCPEVGKKGKKLMKEIRRKGDGKVICSAS